MDVVSAAIRRGLTLLVALLLTGLGALMVRPEPAAADETGATKVLLLLDVSGSMNEQISGGGTKFAAAKRALKEVAGALPAGTEVGLRVYGSEIAEPKAQNPKACTDTRLVLPVGPLDRSKMFKAVDSFEAVGETPIAYSLEKSVDDLGETGKRVLVLISDGEETCQADPCPTAEKLAKSGVDLQFNAIGLAVGSEARKQLQCIADAGGGSYYDAAKASELSEVIRKITQRALRPFQLSGTPVKGTVDSSGAPQVAPGQYLDRYDRSKTQRHYLIPRQPGSTVTASITSLVKGSGTGSSDSWGLDLRTQSGQRCADESVGVGSYNRVGVLAGAVSSTATGGAGASASAGPCATEPLVLGLTRNPLSSTTKEVPVEIRIVEEPPITNVATLPEGVTSYTGQGKEVAAGATKAAVGGSSFSNAEEVGAGSWTDTVAVGETVLYRVRLEPGQTLRTTLDAPAPKSSWRLEGAETVLPDLEVYTPSRISLRRVTSPIQGNRTATLTIASPEVRVRNREYASPTGAAVRSASVAGDFYIAVGLQPGQNELTGRVMPIRLNVAVDGQPTGRPEYAVATASATPSATSNGTAPGTSAAPSTPPPATGRGLPITGLLVGAGALVVASVIGALLLARRRGRRS